MKPPAISIVIPCFNRVQCIPDTLESVMAQSVADWECLVVDDGSTDGSIQAVKEIARRDSRIKLLSRDRHPKGACACRNIGLQHARGTYLIFLDSDDLLAPGRFKDDLLAFKEDPALEAVISQCQLFYYTPGDNDTLHNSLEEENALERFLTTDIVWMTSSPTWNTSWLRENLEWNESLSIWQDWEFHCRAAMKLSMVQFRDKTGYFWRTSESHTRISNSFNEADKLQRCYTAVFAQSKALAACRLANTPKNRRLLASTAFFLSKELTCLGDKAAGQTLWTTFCRQMAIPASLRIRGLINLKLTTIALVFINKLRNWTQHAFEKNVWGNARPKHSQTRFKRKRKYPPK